jgi:hypothetical protein
MKFVKDLPPLRHDELPSLKGFFKGVPQTIAALFGLILVAAVAACCCAMVGVFVWFLAKFMMFYINQ